MAQRVWSLPAMQETWIWSLVWEDPLEKAMATQSSILASVCYLNHEQVLFCETTSKLKI